MGYGVTNVLHENVTRTYLHRIMAMVSSFFVTEMRGELRYLMMDSETDIFNNAEHTSAHDHLFDHLPSLDASGLLDVVALGNLCEAGLILQRHCYGVTATPAVIEEAAVARLRYREFQVVIGQDLTVIVDGKEVSLHWVLRRSLVEFMAALVTYKTTMEDQTLTPGCTSVALKRRVHNFFTTEYPELLGCWKQLVAEGHKAFYWTGPSFTISPLEEDAPPQVMLYELEGWEIYDVVPQGNATDPETESDDPEASQEPSGEDLHPVVEPLGKSLQAQTRGAKRKFDSNATGEFFASGVNCDLLIVVLGYRQWRS
jgi:hypothetical protein